MGSYSYFQC
ncbi:hypothetical protein D031_4589A, partial [Vibrio parahaemolyticus VP-48]